LKPVKTYNTISATAAFTYTKWKDYAMLVKLRLSLMVVISSVFGYLIAAGGDFSWSTICILGIGGFLITSAANALNQVLERDFDCNMSRTLDRPVTAGRMKSSEAVLFAGIACMVGVSMLSSLNTLSAFLGMLSMVLYAFIYTPVKRYSTLAVAIGAIPGALPVLIGAVAVNGQLTYLGLGLFAVQFLWQFPHFWAIGYNSFEDYKKAGFKLLPVSDGQIDRSLGKNAAMYALFILPVLAGMYAGEMMNIYALVSSVILTLGYIFYSIKFHAAFDKVSALRLMFYSFIYLPLFLLSMLIFNGL
jgi:protoheme IX farnesyltransferase